MMKHASPAPSRRGMPGPVKLPWPLMLLLALNVIPELIFQLTDHGIIGPPWLRPLAYAFGAFQHDLVKNGTFFLGQPLTMFFTYGLLHTGIAHLTINMIGLVWLGRLGLDGFETVIGIGEVDFHPKPDPRAYAAVIAATGLDPSRAAMFEDDPRNLQVPASLGMETILVGEGRRGPDAPAGNGQHGAHVRHHTRDLTAFLRALV